MWVIKSSMCKILSFVILLLGSLQVSANDDFILMEGYYSFNINVQKVEQTFGKVRLYSKDGRRMACIRIKEHDFMVNNLQLREDGKYHARAKLFGRMVPVSFQASTFNTVTMCVNVMQQEVDITLESISVFEYEEDYRDSSN